MLAVSAARARSFIVTTRISWLSIVSTPKRIPLGVLVAGVIVVSPRRRCAAARRPRSVRASRPPPERRPRATAARSTPAPSPPPRRLERDRVEHLDHAVGPVSAVDLHRVAGLRVHRGGDPLAHQRPDAGALKLRPHGAAIAARPVRVRSCFTTLIGSTYRRISSSISVGHVLGEAGARPRSSGASSRSVSSSTRSPAWIAGLRARRSRGDLPFQRLEQADVGIRIHAAHAAPVAGEADLRVRPRRPASRSSTPMLVNSPFTTSGT
jgi:hypothetical protein